MKADPFAQLKLLDVQELDSRHDQLRHRLSTLPQIAELKELAGRRTVLENAARDARILVDDLSREQKRADADVEQVKARRKRDQDRMDQGLISNPKDLERMQHELTSLERRIATLEDEELEVMEQREGFDHEVARLEAARAEIQAEIDRLAALIAEEEATIDAELAGEVAAREALVPGIPDSMLGLYEQVRVANRGIGAARLVGSTCQACHLALPATEVDRIRHLPPEAMARCDHCGAILVR